MGYFSYFLFSDSLLDNLTVGMNASMRPNQAYDLVDPATGKVYPFNPNRVWAFIPESMNKMITGGRIVFPGDTLKRPMQKRFKNELKSACNPFSTLMMDRVGLNTEATRTIQEIMGGNIFDYSKPISLLKTLIPQVTEGDDLIVDFFAGSRRLSENAVTEFFATICCAFFYFNHSMLWYVFHIFYSRTAS